MTFWLIPLGLLLLSLLISHFFVRRQKPILGFALGILPILAFWLYYSLRAEQALHVCRNDITARCEWTGIGILLITVMSLAPIILSAVAVGLMELARVFWRRKTMFGAADRALYPWSVWLSLLAIVLLAGVGLAAGYLLFGVLRVPSPSWFAPFIAVVAGTLYMVLRERRAEPKQEACA